MVARKKLPGALTTAVVLTVCVFIPLNACHKTNVPGTSLAPKKSGPVRDLSAIRVGDEISLNWTTPRKGMSKLIVNGSIRMKVCRLESTDGGCTETGPPFLLAPGAVGTFAEELSALMASGPPRVAYYSVMLLDRNGVSIGLDNRVPVLVGAPPPLVQGLTAETNAKGVVLRWEPASAGTAAGETTIRLRRTEGLPTDATQAMRDGLVPLTSRPESDLFAKDGSAGAMDTGVHPGTTYQYRAQRVFRISVDGQTMEMDGQFSPEVQVDLPSQPH